MIDQRVYDALRHIPSDDRDLWIRVGMGLHDAYGDEAFPIWDQWSRNSVKYNVRSTKYSWNSFTAGGGITIASMFALAKEGGYAGKGDIVMHPSDLRESRKRQIAAQEKRQREADRAAEEAQWMVEEAEWKDHPYLKKKLGKDARPGLVDDEGRLLIPMSHHRQVVAVQAITEDGGKKFLPHGCSVSGAVHAIGPARAGQTWWVEGYATGQTVYRTLQDNLYRESDRVVVCFSAHNLSRTARRGVVVADHDSSGTGRVAAEKTGCRIVMPEITGDANDLWHDQGPNAVASMLRTALVA